MFSAVKRWLGLEKHPRAVVRHLSSRHGDSTHLFSPGIRDEAWFQVEALAGAVVADGGVILRSRGPAAPAERIKSLDELKAGEEALLIPRVVGG